LAERIFYKASVEKDLRRIGADSARIIRKFEASVQSSRAGEALKGRFEGMYKFRVGDYRVIYAKIREGVLVLRISHRKESYR